MEKADIHSLYRQTDRHNFILFVTINNIKGISHFTQKIASEGGIMHFWVWGGVSSGVRDLASIMFIQNFKYQRENRLVTLKIRSRSPKSNQLFIVSQ